MRRIVVSVLIVLAGMFSQNVSAQDIIVTQDGDAKKVYGVEVSESAIFYKTADAADSPIQRIDKKDVLVIKYKDGTSKVFSGDAGNVAEKKQPVATTATEETGPVMLKPSDLGADAAAANAKLLTEMNNPITYKPENPDDDANRALMGFGVKSTSVMDDGNVKIDIVQGTFYKRDKKTKPTFSPIGEDGYLYTADLFNPGMMLKVQNKTNKTVYIDLGNSFYIRLGQSICYYVPSSTTTSSSSGSGVGVNLGSVAGALNVGGVVGQLASGVNVGGGKSSGASSTTYAQRVISIPPMATYNLEPVFLFIDEAGKMCKGLEIDYDAMRSLRDFFPRVNFSKKSAGGPLVNGMHYTYTEEDTPIVLSNVITYSFSEDCSNARMLSVHLYLKDVIEIKTKMGMMSTKLKGKLQIQKNAFFILAKVSDDSGNEFQRGALVND